MFATHANEIVYELCTQDYIYKGKRLNQAVNHRGVMVIMYLSTVVVFKVVRA